MGTDRKNPCIYAAVPKRKLMKRETSVRIIFLPKSVAIMLQEWKDKQEEAKVVLGIEYQKFSLVMATTFGHPTDGAAICNDLKN